MATMKRDKKIDILRAIALFGIIIAHVNPPDILAQLRSFDVPLMAMLMGTSFYLTNKDREVSYLSYIIKRVKRLLIPTWQFLTIFFVLFFVVSLIADEPFYFGLEKIIQSYTLIGGIGYVWIVGVFLLVALLNPVLLMMSKKVNSNVNYFLILTAVYLVYLVLVQVLHVLDGFSDILYRSVVLYTIGYGLIAAIGIRIKQLSRKEIGALTVLFLCIYVFLMFQNDFALTSIAKYPPTMYYLSYAFFASLFLYLLLDRKMIYKIFDNKFISFNSENSFWIYLWHIIPVYIISLFGNDIPFIEYNFVTRLLFVFSIACLLTILQNRLTSNSFFRNKSKKGTAGL